MSCDRIINAAGPWVSELLTRRLKINDADKVRLVKGSHIVVPRMFAHDHAYIFQQPDRRIVFAIPYEVDFTVIGTTVLAVPTPPLSAPARAPTPATASTKSNCRRVIAEE